MGASLGASSIGLAGGIESAFVIRTHEANLYKAYQARKFLLREEEMEDLLMGEDEDVDLIPNEYAFMEKFFE